jgi:hypothetical protein
MLGLAVALLALASLPAGILRHTMLSLASASALPAYRTYLALTGFAILFAVALTLVQQG